MRCASTTKRSRTFRSLRREHLSAEILRSSVASASSFQIDRTSGSVVWPALLRDDSRFSEDVRKVNQGLVKWTQDGCDPTSLGALRVRKTIEKMTRDLLVMRTTGLIDADGLQRGLYVPAAHGVRNAIHGPRGSPRRHGRFRLGALVLCHSLVFASRHCMEVECRLEQLPRK